LSILFFVTHHTATTHIHTLSLHDALPIYSTNPSRLGISLDIQTQLQDFGIPVNLLNLADPYQNALSEDAAARFSRLTGMPKSCRDRKSTRLNSSHQIISYAVFCLKKKKQQ